MGLLPKEEGTSYLKGNLQDIDFTKLYNAADHYRVIATMPEYQYGFGKNLVGLCEEMGVRSAFTDQADFSPMTTERLWIEVMTHNAHIEVDRKGTRATAVTIIGCGSAEASIPQPPKRVRLDRPFVYAIMHQETGLPVFVGVMNHADCI